MAKKKGTVSVKNKVAFGIAAALLLVIGAGAVAAFGGAGFHGGPDGMPSGRFAGASAVQSAIQSGDYNAYLAAAANETNARRMGNLTQDQFNTLHQNFVQMNATRTQMQQEQQAVTQAIANNDYAAWKSAIESTLTQQRFDSLVNEYQARQARMNQTQAGASGAAPQGNAFGRFFGRGRFAGWGAK